MSEQPTVNRPDTRALRAMSHPTRLEILGILRIDGPATASGLASRLGLNSGATSYHLRQLGDAGLIEEDAERGSRRDRWWRATHDSTRTELPTPDPADQPVTLAFVRAALRTQIQTLQRADAERDDLPDEWLRASTNSDWAIRLTPTQAEALVLRLFEELSACADAPAPAGDETAETVVFQLHSFPFPGRVTAPQGRQGDEPA